MIFFFYHIFYISTVFIIDFIWVTSEAGACLQKSPDDFIRSLDIVLIE